MRYILILLLFISGAASAQFAPTSAKSKFSNGIAIGSKDTSAFSAADTMVLTIARDSVMYYKYRGVWRPIATGGNLNNYKLISDTLFNNGYTTRGRTKQYGDSIAVLKLNISDTAAMLAPFIQYSDTTGLYSQVVRTFGTQTVGGNKTFSNDIVVNGLTMGRGAGNVSQNTVVGNGALNSNTTGEKNTAVGVASLSANTTGVNNSALGFSALAASTGGGNTAVGHIALSETTGGNNTAVGDGALAFITTQSSNTAIGGYAGAYTAAVANNTSSNNSVYIGANTRTSAIGQLNEIVIGEGVTGNGSNTVTIGNSSVTNNYFSGRLNSAGATFTSSGSSNTVEIAHSSGSGIALNITKGGNGEGLYVNKTSGSGNAATIIGTLNATTLVKSGGTSSQFLMADGSVNTSVLPSGAYLPLSGGTLTGALSGTSAAFSGTMAVGGSTLNSGGANAQFQVNGAGGAFFVRDNGQEAYFTATGINYFGTLNNSALQFLTNNATRLTLSSGGNTLIKTSTDNGTDALQVAGSGRFTQGVNMATSSGNVGIGSTSPTYKLDVRGNVLIGDNTTNTVRIGSYSAESFIYSSSAIPLTLYTNATERMRITSGGNLLIKTTTDNGTDALQVAGSVYSSGILNIGKSQSGNAALTVKSPAGGNTGIILIEGDRPNDGWGLYSVTSDNFIITRFTDGSFSDLFTMTPTGAATFSSTVTATGFIVSSDRRLKNILSRSGDMVTYTLKADKNKILHYGYIAQEVEKVLPTTVSTDDKGMKAVNYIEVLVKKVNDLEKEIAELKKHNK